MRTRTITLLVLGAVLAVSPLASAKRRSVPTTCPADVQAMVDEVCPCDGRPLPDGTLTDWRSHGQYVSCVTHLRNALRKAGCLSENQRRTVARCAGHSTCGKADAVVCCLTDVGTCVLAPDGTTGTCNNDPNLACDVDDDCLSVKGRMVRDSSVCDDLGGEAADGSECNACDGQ